MSASLKIHILIVNCDLKKGISGVTLERGQTRTTNEGEGNDTDCLNKSVSEKE
jgi:hypothetical protein